VEKEAEQKGDEEPLFISFSLETLPAKDDKVLPSTGYLSLLERMVRSAEHHGFPQRATSKLPRAEFADAQLKTCRKCQPQQSRTNEIESSGVSLSNEG